VYYTYVSLNRGRKKGFLLNQFTGVIILIIRIIIKWVWQIFTKISLGIVSNINSIQEIFIYTHNYFSFCLESGASDISSKGGRGMEKNMSFWNRILCLKNDLKAKNKL
jgi:hypothetical protein